MVQKPGPSDETPTLQITIPAHNIEETFWYLFDGDLDCLGEETLSFLTRDSLTLYSESPSLYTMSNVLSRLHFVIFFSV